MSNPTSNQKLIERFQGETGEAKREAFKELYVRHENTIWRYLVRISRDAGLADELTQKTFEKILNGLEKLQSRGSFNTWSYGIVSNTWKEHTKQRQQQPDLIPEEDRGNRMFPEDQVSKRNEFKRVRKALDGLSDKYKIPLVLVRYEGLDYRDAAKVLGVSGETFQIRVHHAQKKITATLENQAWIMEDTHHTKLETEGNEELTREQARLCVTKMNAGELLNEEWHAMNEYSKNHPEFRKELEQLEDAWNRLDILEEEVKFLQNKSGRSGEDYRAMSESLRDKLNKKTSGTATNETQFAEEERVSSPTPEPTQKTRSPQKSHKQQKEHRSRSTTRRPQPKQERPAGVRPRGAVAGALILIAILGIVLLTFSSTNTPERGQTKAIARILNASADTTLIRRGEKMPVDAGEMIHQNDQLHVSGDTKTEVKYKYERTHIFLRDNARATFNVSDGEKRIDLISGVLEGDVQTQSKEKKLIVTHPEGHLEIEGTKFILTASDTTRIEVLEGTVRFYVERADQTVSIEAGEYAEVGPDQPFNKQERTETSKQQLRKPKSTDDKTKNPVNKPPVADAGSDRTIIDSDGNGSETITLDGSDSYDPDGKITSYKWVDTAWDKTITTGPKAEVGRTLGEYELKLVVTDNSGASTSDICQINIKKKE